MSQPRQIGVTLNLRTDEYTACTAQLTGRKIEEASVTGWIVGGTRSIPTRTRT